MLLSLFKFLFCLKLGELKSPPSSAIPDRTGSELMSKKLTKETRLQTKETRLQITSVLSH